MWVFPDVVGFYEEYLPPLLEAAGIFADVSRTFSAGPGDFVWLQSDGGRRLDATRDNPRLRVNCLSDLNIGTLTAAVRALVFDSVGAGPVRRVTEAAGPVDVPNVKPWRYMAFEVIVVGSPLTLA